MPCCGKVFGQGYANKSCPLRDQETNKKLLDQVKLKQCTNVIGDMQWAIDNNDMLGYDVQIATKNVVDTNSGKTKRLTALAVRDIFHKNIELKVLCIVWTGLLSRAC